jgi:glycerol kinase
LRRRAEDGELLFGTMDSWLVWNLTGRHVTDVTNASRTMLMNLETLDWDDTLLEAIGVPRAMLPAIQSSSQIYGEAGSSLAGVPIAAALGDQQAALFGELPASEHRREAGAVGTWIAHDGGIQDRR